MFPELRSRCRKRGGDFIGLDLRWGVTEEEAEREGALAVCLTEIERCRPFFVCLLGDRFGWVPAPDEIPGLVFDAVREEASSEYRMVCCRPDGRPAVMPRRARRTQDAPIGDGYWNPKACPGR